MSACLLFAFLFIPYPTHAQDVQSAAAAESNDDEVVYIDPDGFLRVYDPTGSPQITWVSPEGGWTAAALGDFTGDGDDEIVAVGGEGSGSRLVIYDPVIASGTANPAQLFNGIPWKQLYITFLPDTPRLVATGEFNLGIPGQEIILTWDLPAGAGDRRSAVTVLQQTASPADGTAWAEYTSASAGQQWSDISTGDLAVTGMDDIVLIDEDKGVLDVYRVVNGILQRYFHEASDTRPWSGSAIGEVDPATAQPELVLVRRADRPLASLVVWRYDSGEFVDVYLRDFAPAPRVVFLADVNGTGEKEIFLLRNVNRTAGCPAPYNSPPFQLLMRNRGPDTLPNFEVCLDQANTFRYGIGADIDGDGKDEVVVLSATQLRIFDNLTTTFTASDVAISSDARTIAAGNLDRSGFVKVNTLVASQSRLDFTISAGTQSSPAVIQLTNSGGSTPIPLIVRTSPQADFVHWSLNSTVTPAALTVYADARELLPNITYATDLVIDSAGIIVSNTPLRIPVLVRVEDGLVVKPAASTVVVVPCTTPPPQLKVDLRVFGSAGMTFGAEVSAGAPGAGEQAAAGSAGAVDSITWPVAGSVPWITRAESPAATVPSTITLTLDPSLLGGFDQAQLALTGQLNGVTYQRTAAVSVVCTDNAGFLPYTSNNSWPD